MKEVIDIDGVKFQWDSSSEEWNHLRMPKLEDEPVPSALKFYTLNGMVDYIKQNTEGLIPEPGSEDRLILHVYDWETVVLLSKPSKNNKVRSIIAKVEAHTPEIKFGCHMDNEYFCTMLLSNFIDTPARADLFKVVKCLTNEQSMLRWHTSATRRSWRRRHSVRRRRMQNVHRLSSSARSVSDSWWKWQTCPC